MVRKSDESTGKEKYARNIITPVGPIRLESNSEAILSVSFLKDPLTDPEKDSAIQPPCLEQCENQLREYFAGKRKDFDLPLAPHGTEFQEKVWTQLLDIPYGVTISYLQLAKFLGNAKLIRAAGAANGRNPLAILIPCHRVIGANGELVGYAGGLSLKKWLLEHEKKYHTGITQVSLFGLD